MSQPSITLSERAQSPEARRSLPLFGISGGEVAHDEPQTAGAGDVSEQLAAYEAAERDRMGLRQRRRQWVDDMIDPEFLRKERGHVTLLSGGLTQATDFLIEGAMRGIGYRFRTIGTPNNDALQLGKEYGNRGQCNPTYFNVGALVQFLQHLRDDEGLSPREIVKSYAFVMPGACGPCRFGMYVTEYRKALRDAGFEGFRVLQFQQKGGLSQSAEEMGLELNERFFMAFFKALVCGDVLNAIGYRIRPYEKVPGETQRVLEHAQRVVYKALLEESNVFAALYKCRKMFDAIEVDKLRAKPKTAIIGEFWAMTTEGDGNYHLQHFLESEGAECDIQLTTAWVLYNIWEVARDTRERELLRVPDSGRAGLREHQGELDVAKRQATLRLADWGLRMAFQAFAVVPGLHGYHLPDMDEIAEIADEYYSNDLRGGEGHMEVGKLIMNVVSNKAHMTLSVKPFGCMPSSGVSDGIQSLITTKYPGTVFCAVETSGDGATNFYSRVQMYLYKARIAAEEELRRTYLETGVSEEQVRRFLADNPEYASPLHHSPHAAAGSAANLVHEVAPLIKMSQSERVAHALRKAAKRVGRGLAAAPPVLQQGWRVVRDPEFVEAARTDAEIVRDLLKGKAKDLYGPLVRRLLARATESEAVQVEQPLAAE